MNNLAIDINNLTKKYGSFTAVNEVSFSVKTGEVFGFLGPNGAGKTTTIRILIGLSKPTSGSCRVLGHDIVRADQFISSKLGVVFEESNLYQRLSGQKNLDFYARLYGVGKCRVRELLDRYGLIEAATRPVKKYSKGMKQRLLICRALLAEPELLVLDEPTSGLDPVSAEIIRKSINEFKESGKTVFLSTHYMEEADELCDRVAFISRGEIAAVDTPDILKQKYRKPVLEIRIQGNVAEKIEALLTEQDKVVVDNNITVVKLALELAGVGRKLDKIREQTEVLDIHSREATLQEVFKKLI